MDGMIAEGLIIGTLISTAVPASESASIPTAKQHETSEIRTALRKWYREEQLLQTA